MSDMEIEHAPVDETEKNIMDTSLINKILGMNKKLKQAPKRAAKVLLPPCLVYVSNAKQTVLKVPFSYSIGKQFTKPRLSEKKKCFCGAIAKYKKPGSLEPYCSLNCYRKLA